MDRTPPPGDTQFAEAAELLKALAHPARLRIAVALGDHDHCVHELVDLLDQPQPAVSQHLQVLRAARVVSGRRVGREVRYSLVDEHIAHIAADAVSHAGEHHRDDPLDARPVETEHHTPHIAPTEEEP